MDAFNCPICGVSSVLRCGGCKNVYYCCKEHQILHWRTGHKTACKNYEILKNEKLGRYMVATRDIKIGEEIFREEPLVLGPKVASMPICLGCHRLLPPPKEPETNFYKCTKCNWPLCGPECELSNFHHDECQLMSSRNFDPKIDYVPEKFEALNKESSYCAILPLRCMILKQKNPKAYEKVTKLEHHLETRLDSPLYKILCPNLLTFIKTILGLVSWKDTEIMRIAAALDTNAFEVRQRSTGRKVRALYPEAAMISHDCSPNTRHIFDDNMCAIFYSKKPITKGDIISISYTQALWGTLQRRIHLEQLKCFQCVCERCTDPTEFGTYAGAINCYRCKIGKIISTNPLNNDASWHCNLCSHEVSAKQMQSGNATLEKELRQTNKTSVEGFENFLRLYSSTLHETNTHALQAKFALSQLYGTSQQFPYFDIISRKIELCRELLAVADKLDGGRSVLRGTLLLGLQEAITLVAKHDFVCGDISRKDYQEKLKEPMEMLKEAYEIMKVDPNQESKIKVQMDILNVEMNIDLEY